MVLELTATVQQAFLLSDAHCSSCLATVLFHVKQSWDTRRSALSSASSHPARMICPHAATHLRAAAQCHVRAEQSATQHGSVTAPTHEECEPKSTDPALSKGRVFVPCQHVEIGWCRAIVHRPTLQHHDSENKNTLCVIFERVR